jgi:hypothetical protein
LLTCESPRSGRQLAKFISKFISAHSGDLAASILPPAWKNIFINPTFVGFALNVERNTMLQVVQDDACGGTRLF